MKLILCIIESKKEEYILDKKNKLKEFPEQKKTNRNGYCKETQ